MDARTDVLGDLIDRSSLSDRAVNTAADHILCPPAAQCEGLVRAMGPRGGAPGWGPGVGLSGLLLCRHRWRCTDAIATQSRWAAPGR